MKIPTFWDTVQPGDPVMDKYGGIIDPADAPMGTIIAIVPTAQPGKYEYYYDPEFAIDAEHGQKAIDARGIHWPSVTSDSPGVKGE